MASAEARFPDGVVQRSRTTIHLVRRVCHWEHREFKLDFVRGTRLTGGKGIDAAFDFVGADATLATAASVMAKRGALTVVGIAGGHFDWSFFGVPYEVNFSSTYWGTIEDLYEVVAMARAGQIVPDVERFSMDDALVAYDKLQNGDLKGRAVVVPHR